MPAKKPVKPSSSKKGKKPGKPQKPAGKSNGKKEVSASDWKKQVSGLEKKWKEERKKQNGTGEFSLPEIADGLYWCQATAAKFGISEATVKDEDGNEETVNRPWVRIDMIVKGEVDGDSSTESEYEGVQIGYFASLINPYTTKTDRSLEFFARAVHNLGYDAEDFDISSVPDFVDKINEDKPSCAVRVENKEVKGKKVQNYFINRQLDDEGNAVETEDEDGDDD